MPIPIHKEDEEGPGLERCCFCRERTKFWTSLGRRAGEQVACCPHCASRAEPIDVPAKWAWCRRERIAHHPTIREIAEGKDQEFLPAPIVPCPES